MPTEATIIDTLLAMASDPQRQHRDSEINLADAVTLAVLMHQSFGGPMPETLEDVRSALKQADAHARHTLLSIGAGIELLDAELAEQRATQSAPRMYQGAA